MLSSRFSSCSALAGLLFIGCATTSGGGSAPKSRNRRSLRVKQPFPSKARVDELGSAKVDQPLARVGTMAAVTSWSVDPSTPDADWKTTYAGTDPNSAAFVTWAKAKAPKVTVSASMTCVAQQYARFAAEHQGAVVGADVRAFIHARCGVPAPQVSVFNWSFKAGTFRALDPNAPEPKVMEVLDGASKRTLAGLGVWKTDDRAFVAVAFADPDFELAPLPFDSGSGGSVMVRGSYGRRTEWMQASISHGPLGAKRCTRVPAGGSKGGFAFRCPTNPQDPSAVVELAAAPKGSVLGNVFARAFISPNGSAPTQYDAPALNVPAPAGDFSPAAVLAGVNALRSQAGLPDVVGAPHQDSVSKNLFPHLLGNTNASVRNEAALGIVAGWQVEDTIRQASFETMFAHADTPLDRMLAGGLFFPGFRAVTLGKDTRVLSTATLDSEQTSTRGLLSVAYEVFEPGDFAAEEAAVYDALDDARAKVGLEPVTRVQGGKDENALADSAERIRTGESTPSEELDRMVTYFRESVQRDFYGVIYSPTLIEGWTPDFDDEFFKHEKLAVSITVSYFTPPGAAWGQHIVMLVFTPL